MRRALSPRPLLLTLAALAAGSSWADDFKDPWFGEALYHAYQGQYFEALDGLDK